MAFVVCATHGGNGAAAVCSHIADSLVGDTPTSFKFKDLFSVTVDYVDESMGPLYYCPECARQYGLRDRQCELTGDSGIDKMYEMGWTPVCPKCFTEQFGNTT